MVVLVDLESGTEDPLLSDYRSSRYQPQGAKQVAEDASLPIRPNPNLSGFSAAVGCYPIACQLATHLDLNSLHDLSHTCRQIRANLLQYRSQLIAHTLRCENEDAAPGLQLGDRFRESHEAWNTYGANGIRIGRITSGRVGACARDMVGGCRRCGRIVCRNCIIKHPQKATLRGRHRRLCRTCMKSPLERHTCLSGDNEHEGGGLGTNLEACAGQAFAHEPCNCYENVWICQPCGQASHTADIAYIRAWTWRTRYSTYLGGLGTGIGEGAEGVECGRRDKCLAAREVEKEIDCDADEMASLRAEAEKAKLEGRSWSGTSYRMQEIEGIGGVVKKKVKQRVRIGQTVKEYEDEREHGGYLVREQTGQNRSWCSWCERIIPATKGLRRVSSDESLQPTSSNSSTSSI